MGLLDRIKGAVTAVTGGGATVTIQCSETGVAGRTVAVKVTATAKRSAIKSDGIFVDFIGEEEIVIPRGDDEKLAKLREDYRREVSHSKQEFQLHGEFTLAANETKTVDGTIQLPTSLQPSFEGRFSKNHYVIRGRLEAKGNDPDSGWRAIRIVSPS